jgi:predicted nucleic acid-binding protein
MMFFVIDTNIVFAALTKDSIVRNLLIDSQFTLFAPDTLIKEIKKYEEFILQKSGLSKEEFEMLFALITENISIIQKEDYEEKIQEAKHIIGSIDIKDVPFIALALSITNDGIWSDDNHFTKQNKIKVWKTQDVVKLADELGINKELS